MDAEFIKSYLVKLGVKVDNSGVDSLKKALKDIESAVAKTSQEFSAGVIHGASNALAAIVSLSGAVIGMMDQVAKSEMQTQLFARQMYMGVDAAKAFKRSIDALGYSLNDIAWNPELRERYFELVKEVKEMKVPEEAKSLNIKIRDIGFEWTRMKISALSAMDWVSFHLAKLNKGEMSSLSGILHRFNDLIQDKMPEWTAKAAKFLNFAIQSGETFGKILGGLLNIIKSVFYVISSIWEKMPQWARTLNIFIAAFIPLLFGGPVIKGIAALTSALLLLDDAIGYFEGRDSHPFLKFFWDMGETITISFTKVIGNALLAWTHFQKALHGEEGWNEAWNKFLSEKAQMNAEIDKELAHIRKEREENRRENQRINAQNEQNTKEEGVKKYVVPPVGTTIFSPGNIKSVEEFKQRIGMKESGGNYLAVGPENSKGRGRALGKFQFTKQSWDLWTRKFNYSANLPMTPENQESIATRAIDYLAKKYNYNWQLVSIAWVAGESRADAVRAGNLTPLGWSVGGGLKETVNDYVRKTTGSYYKPLQQPNKLSERNPAKVIDKYINRKEKNKYFDEYVDNAQRRLQSGNYASFNERVRGATPAANNVVINQGGITIKIDVRDSRSTANDIAEKTAQEVERVINRRNLILNRGLGGVVV